MSLAFKMQTEDAIHQVQLNLSFKSGSTFKTIQEQKNLTYLQSTYLVCLGCFPTYKN